MVSRKDQVAQRKVKGVADDLLAELKKEILQVFRRDAGPVIKALYLDVYDRIASEAEQATGPAVRGKDPISLIAARPLFAAQLDRDLANIRFDGEELVINIMDRADLGFGESEAREGPPRTADMLHFYIEGVAGEWAFVSREQVSERLEAIGRSVGAELGRVGGGFMVSREKYISQKWEERTGLSFDEVRHPISGFRRVRDFERAIRKVDMRRFIEEAVQKATKNLGLG